MVKRPAPGRQEVIAELKCYDFERPVPLEELTDDVISLLRDSSLHVTHSPFFGLFNAGVRDLRIVAEILATAFNPQLAASSHSPITNEIELGFFGFNRLGTHSEAGVTSNTCAPPVKSASRPGA